jgi:hypothetical protein
VVSNVNYTVYRGYHTFDNLVQYFSDAGLMLSKVECNGKCTINPGVTTGAQVSSHPRTQGLVGKDPGIVWSRDSTKINCPKGSGKVSNYSLKMLL